MKTIVSGKAKGKVLVSKNDISFYGSIDPKTGKIVEKGHDLFGKSVTDKILVFPQGKGSTVGSYKIYEMKKLGTAPKAMIVEKAEPIIVVGCVLAEIPLFEEKNLSLKTGEFVKIENEKIVLEQ